MKEPKYKIGDRVWTYSKYGAYFRSCEHCGSHVIKVNKCRVEKHTVDGYQLKVNAERTEIKYFWHTANFSGSWYEKHSYDTKEEATKALNKALSKGDLIPSDNNLYNYALRPNDLNLNIKEEYVIEDR